MADTHSEKQKEVELQILQAEWPTCETDTLVDPLPKKVTEEKAQTSLENSGRDKSRGAGRREGRDAYQQTDLHDNISQE